jgi:hypothetical protein
VTFSEDLKKFSLRCEAKTQENFVEITTEVQRAVVEGSEIVGSAGQPVDTGNLKSSWVGRFVNPLSWTLETNVVYAKSIEDGISYSRGGTPMQLRSPVGGFHSVKNTVANFGKIVDTVVKRNQQ